MEQQDRPGWSPPPAHDGLSAPETVSSPQRRSRVGTGIAVAAIGIGALGIAGTAYAASASTSPTPSPSSGSPGYGAPRNGQSGALPGAPQGGYGLPGRGGPGRGGGPGDGGGGLRGGMGLGMGAIHGSFVTPKQGGGFQTIDTQRGKVTAVSPTSISVTSDDGFAATYVVTPDTLVNAKRDGIGSIKVKDVVGVVGIENAGSTTAIQIVDRTQIGDGWKKFAPPQQPGAAAPKPSATSTA